jgi:hypothetical protein
MADLEEIKKIADRQAAIFKALDASRAKIEEIAREAWAVQDSIKAATGDDAFKPLGQAAEQFGTLKEQIKAITGEAQAEEIRARLASDEPARTALLARFAELESVQISRVAEQVARLQTLKVDEVIRTHLEELANRGSAIRAAFESAAAPPPGLDLAPQLVSLADLTRAADEAMRASVLEVLRQIEERQWASLDTARLAIAEFDRLTGALPPDLADEITSPVLFLSPEAEQEYFDEQAREALGISGDEFRRRWRAGEYRDIADDPEHGEILRLAAMLPVAS